MPESDYLTGMDFLFKGKFSINSLQAYLQMSEEERINAVLSHFQKHRILSSASDNQLKTTLIERVGKTIKKDGAEALFRAFQIGIIIGSNSKESDISQKAASQKRAALIRRTLPLKAHHIAQKLLKGLVKSVAINKWKADTDKKIRIGEMTDLIYAEIDNLKDLNIEWASAKLPEGSKKIVSVIRNTKPPSQKTIRMWVSSIAPKYAKKGGRPRNLT